MEKMEGVELMENEEFKQIIGFENYFISNQGRCYNSKTKNFIGSVNGRGYVITTLHRQNEKFVFSIHVLVMKMFGPPKPDGNYEIDHQNHIRTDNRIENLRWATKSQNDKNRSSYGNNEFEYFDEIPADNDDIIDVRDYGNHEFEDYYYANGYFYFDTGVSFKRLHINFTKQDKAFIKILDKNNKQVKIYYTKFKRLYGLDD